MAVKNSKITSNIDPPEAGLDALAQALLCDGEVQEDGTMRYEKLRPGSFNKTPF